MLFSKIEKFYKLNLKTFILLAMTMTADVLAQVKPGSPSSDIPAEDYTWLYILLPVLLAVGAGIIYWRAKGKETQPSSAGKSLTSQNDSTMGEPLDA